MVKQHSQQHNQNIRNCVCVVCVWEGEKDHNLHPHAFSLQVVKTKNIKNISALHTIHYLIIWFDNMADTGASRAIKHLFNIFSSVSLCWSFILCALLYWHHFFLAFILRLKKCLQLEHSMSGPTYDQMWNSQMGARGLFTINSSSQLRWLYIFWCYVLQPWVMALFRFCLTTLFWSASLKILQIFLPIQ